MGKFKQFLLREALSTELGYLKKMFENSDERSINIDRALSNPHLVFDYLGEEWDDEKDALDIVYDMTEDEQAKFGEFVKDHQDYQSGPELNIHDIFYYDGLIRNEWLIHFSDNAYSIWKDQEFEHGIPHADYERLALSTHFSDSYKSEGGFNFAYLATDADRYHSRPKYGNEAVLFRGSGVKVWHHGDDEPQVIFDGKSSNKPLIHIEEGPEKAYAINSTITGKKLVESDSISEIVEWVDANFPQYRKHLEA